MYLIDDMIDLGLKESESWPSDAHKAVAQNVCLGNSLITTRDALIESVQVINQIPIDKIKTVTFLALVFEYRVPHLTNFVFDDF